MKYETKVRTIGISIFIIAFLIVGIAMSNYFATEQSIQITVKDKERIAQNSGARQEHKYIIHTQNETLEITDQLWYWKWNSTDIYRELERGKTYKVRIVGWRLPILSTYRNIIRIEQKVSNQGTPSKPIAR